jgi:type 1 fimbria pilin
MKRLSMIGVLALVLAGCGGSADDADVAETSTAGAGPSISPSDDGSTDAGAPAVDGIGVASVTLDGETYLFGDTGQPGLQCKANFLGIYTASLPEIDEAGNEVPEGANVRITLLHDGTDPDVVGQLPVVTLSLRATSEDWIADETFDDDLPQVEPGNSQVDDYTIDGNTASGTATFIDRYTYTTDQKTAKGTFTATCGEGG